MATLLSICYSASKLLFIVAFTCYANTTQAQKRVNSAEDSQYAYPGGRAGTENNTRSSANTRESEDNLKKTIQNLQQQFQSQENLQQVVQSLFNSLKDVDEEADSEDEENEVTHSDPRANITTGSGDDLIRIYYEKAAKSYRDASNKTSCPYNKRCYLENAAYLDFQAKALGSDAPACMMAQPICKAIACPQDAEGNPLGQ